MKQKKILFIAAAFLTSAALSSCGNIFHTSEERDKPDSTTLSEVTSTSQSTVENTSAASTAHLTTSMSVNSTEAGTRTFGILMDSQQTDRVSAEPKNVEEADHSSFKYDQLSDSEKNIYDIVCSGLMQHQQTIMLGSEVPCDSFDRVYNAVLTTMDLQMFCPVRSYRCSGTDPDTAIEMIMPEYRYTADQIEEIRNNVNDKTEEVISQLSNEMTQVDKLKTIHDYIINNCRYTDIDSSASDDDINEMLEKDDNDDAYGVLVKSQGICEGYARAFRYICLRAGIECELVSGISYGEKHMWNLVKVDGSWYHMDVTWDDPVILNGGSDADNIRYDYFNVSDSAIAADHTIDTQYFQYPAADSDSANFYIYFDLYAYSLEKADEIITRELIRVYNDEKRVVFLRTGSDALFAQITDHLFEQNGLYDILSNIQGQADYLSSVQRVYKSIDDDNNTLKIII